MNVSRALIPGWAGSVMTMLGHLTMATSHHRVRDGNTRYTLTSWSLFSLMFTTALSSGIVTRFDVITLTYHYRLLSTGLLNKRLLHVVHVTEQFT